MPCSWASAASSVIGWWAPVSLFAAITDTSPRVLDERADQRCREEESGDARATGVVASWSRYTGPSAGPV